MFLHALMIFWSARKQCKDTFFHPPSPFPCNFCKHNSSGICTASQFYVTLPLLQTMWTYTQKSARKWQLWPSVTSYVKDYKGHSLMQTSFTELPNSTVFCSVFFFSACWVPLAFPQSTKFWHGTRTIGSLTWVCDLFCMCIHTKYHIKIKVAAPKHPKTAHLYTHTASHNTSSGMYLSITLHVNNNFSPIYTDLYQWGYWLFCQVSWMSCLLFSPLTSVQAKKDAHHSNSDFHPESLPANIHMTWWNRL